MKRSITLGLALICLLPFWAIAQTTPPPDVYIQWMQQGVTIAHSATQTIPLVLPQSGISRYSYHYIYLFFNGTCSVSDVNMTGTMATLVGNVPNGGTGSTIYLGGLITQSLTPSGGGTGPVLLIEGNGAANALSANLYLKATTGFNISNCTLDVLYKGTIRPEEGANPVGVFAPSTSVIESYYLSPTITVLSPGRHNILWIMVPPGDTGHKTNFAIEQIVMCALPIYNGTTWVANSLSSVALTMLRNSATILMGHYSLVNGCTTIAATNENLGVIQAADTLQVNAQMVDVTGHTTDGSEFGITIFGRIIY